MGQRSSAFCILLGIIPLSFCLVFSIHQDEYPPGSETCPPRFSPSPSSMLVCGTGWWIEQVQQNTNAILLPHPNSPLHAARGWPPLHSHSSSSPSPGLHKVEVFGCEQVPLLSIRNLFDSSSSFCLCTKRATQTRKGGGFPLPGVREGEFFDGVPTLEAKGNRELVAFSNQQSQPAPTCTVCTSLRVQCALHF